jgi:DNA adenine methylase
MGQSQNKFRSMTVPQPFQYQGSQRALAPLILQYLPISITRLVEPFCGSAALSIATAASGRTKEFWLNDFNAPLAKLLLGELRIPAAAKMAEAAA